MPADALLEAEAVAATELELAARPVLEPDAVVVELADASCRRYGQQ